MVEKVSVHQFKTKIISNRMIAPDHFVLSFKTPKTPKPGQFFNIRVTSSCQPLLRRPFGAHKIEKDRAEILYKVVGRATKILSTKKEGEMLDIIGPLGNGFATSARPGREVVILIAGGHGVAPLVALAKKLTAHRSPLTVFIGAKTKKHIVCDEEFRKLGTKVYIATDDGTKGYKGLVTDLLSRKLTAHSSIYSCGPKPMLKKVAKIAKRHKIPCQVSLEEYMACGIGTCLGCAVKTQSGYKMVCKDGPVFDTKEVVW